MWESLSEVQRKKRLQFPRPFDVGEAPGDCPGTLWREMLTKNFSVLTERESQHSNIKNPRAFQPNLL